jgi:hypothetical protein
VPGEVALQLVQIGFALGIVAAFAALQFGRVGEHDLSYLVTNLVCAGGRTITAVLTAQVGFVISGGFWTFVSAVGLLTVARRSRASQRS